MRFCIKLAAALGVTLAACVPSTAAPFTIGQAISAPFPSELTASPAGGKLAWVFDEDGARNVWVAEAPDYQGRRLTNYHKDDGQDITDLSWSPDGRYLAYVRGEGPNFRGEIPNPAENPKGARQVVFVIGAGGGEPREAGEGVSPAVSNDRVFFVHMGQIMAAPLEGGKAVCLIRTRGQADDLRLSPDATRLAWVSSRVDHSFIGVYDIAAATLLYLDPSVDTDGEPAWSRDGKQVAFVRRAAGGREWGPHRSALTPWSLRVADATTGKGREVWKAAPGPGSAFRALASEKQLFWTADDRIVFPWERDGWLHLYSIQSDGGTPALLTPGAFEVEHATLAPGRHEMIYSSNQGDIDRRHIWRVAVSGGAPAPVTSGHGIEVWPAVASDGTVACLRSDAHKPLRPAVSAAAELHDLAPSTMPAEFPAGAMVEPQQVIFNSGDGLEIHGQLFLPSGAGPARKPALIFFHGGSRRQMLLGWHYMYYYSNAYALNQYFASQGYVVLSVNYRSGIGYGLDFREALNYGATGGAEFNDVLAAGLYLRSRPDVDAQRIGLWGGSYGGYLTALGLARASGQFAAGVDFHGVHDWSTELSGLGVEGARVAWESSPMAYVKDWRSPVLLIHGDDDRNVKFSQTVDLVQALRRQRVEFEELIFPDEVHDFLMHRHWLEAYQATADFFARKLRNHTAANGKLEERPPESGR